ncbi:MAG: TIGR03118 family protein [Bacteroidetes bacterium]|nr:TIGR03118 family protein [Bacteroidota bacterium]
MKKITRTFSASQTVSFFLSLFLLFSIGCRKGNDQRKALKNFSQVNLVDNNGAYGATHQDPTLMNAWGLAFSPNGIAWVNSQAGHVSELYTGEGARLRAINIPSPGDTIGGNPTGIVFNSTKDFVLSNGAAAAFIFVGVDGVVSAWNGAAGNNAFRIANNSSTSAYTGLAFSSSGGANYLYAANFRAGKIDVWDKNFNAVNMSFKDPSLPSGYSPFNIQAVGGWLVVLYAKVGPDGRDQAGPGNGFVSIFNPDGSFVKRFASRGWLNSPWGIVEAPASFFDDNDGDNDDQDNSGSNKGKGKGDNHDNKNNNPILLVGNFGDGRINGFTLDGEFIGQLKSHGKTIVIDKLWALSFAPATATAIDPNRLYFTAGPDEEKDGLFGYLIKQ